MAPNDCERCRARGTARWFVVDHNKHVYLRPYLTVDLQLRLSPRVFGAVVYVLCERCKDQTVRLNKPTKRKPARKLEFYRLEFDT